MLKTFRGGGSCTNNSIETEVKEAIKTFKPLSECAQRCNLHEEVYNFISMLHIFLIISVHTNKQTTGHGIEPWTQCIRKRLVMNNNNKKKKIKR